MRAQPIFLIRDTFVGQTAGVPIVVRLLLGIVGLIGTAVGIKRLRAANESAADASRVGVIPWPFPSIAGYRLAAVLIAAAGLVFIVLAAAAP